MNVLANMINGIKNAGRVQKKEVMVPYSKFKAAIVHKLFEAGYVAGHAKKEQGKIPYLVITLAYDKGGKHKIADIKAVSKQSRRVYFRVKDIKPVKYGKGQLVLSTPKGVLLGNEAREQQVGGEALFEIW